MAAPIITVTNVSKDEISAVLGMDKCIATFVVDQDVIDWKAKANSTFYGNGLLVEEGVPNPFPLLIGDFTSKNYIMADIDALGYSLAQIEDKVILAASAEQTFEVGDEELTAGDGDYNIYVYCQDVLGVWTEKEV